MSSTSELPVSVPNPAYLAHHRFEDSTILPAVEAVSLLARIAQEHKTDLDVHRSDSARFLRFVTLPDDGRPLKATIRLTERADGSVQAELVTKIRLAAAGITRSKTHVEVTFGAAGRPSPPPMDTICALEGICLSFSADRLYPDLVPLGPAFRNVVGTVHLAPTGASGRVRAPAHPAPTGALGSPFPLDAAFQLASVWGQRYGSQLTVPTGYASRTVMNPCRPGEIYFCRVIPLSSEPDLMCFDLWVCDDNGGLREAVCGLRMQDPTTDQRKPADWVQAGRDDPLQELRAHCAGLAVVELDTLTLFAEKAFAPREQTRYQVQSTKRRREFAAAHLALKQLARSLEPALARKAASELETVAEDMVHPLCPLPSHHAARYVSAAHDRRFAVAVAAERAVGVDVEKASERVLRPRRLFLSEEEQRSVSDSALGPEGAATRVWAVKEAAAKALDIPLASAFERIAVTRIGEGSCAVAVDGHPVTARCADVDGHVFALLTLPAGENL